MNKIDKLRKIVSDHQLAKIDGVLIDVLTANAILKVYDNINEVNKEKFSSLDIKKMANVAWSLIK